jgi:hypothetical protein
MFKKIVDQFSRVFVGGLFIFSGLIKLNDPVGTEIKMHEYFEVFASDFGSFFNLFIPWSLEIGLAMIILELMIGVAVLLFFRMDLTTKVLLALLTFFTFLTFYSAFFNKVTDCGCFGDAIKLTPWESFTKDVILMVFTLHLFWYRKGYVSAVRTRPGIAWVTATAGLSLFLGVYAIQNLPFIDFRAYKVGNRIPDQMIAAEAPRIEYTFLKDGEEVSSEKFLMEDQGYKYVSSRVLNEDAAKPKITDYAVYTPAGDDITQQTFEGPVLMLIIYNTDKASGKNVDDIKKLVSAVEGNVRILILTASTEEQIEKFRHDYQLAIPFAFADATVLKTIIRSNPGITLWKDGVVLGNWHHNNTPEPAEIAALLAKIPG